MTANIPDEIAVAKASIDAASTALESLLERIRVMPRAEKVIVSDTVREYLARERETGLTSAAHYADFGQRVVEVKEQLLRLLGDLRSGGATIAGYGAAAKGSTLLNYVGIGRDLVDFVVDRNVHKQGKLMPGTNQPIRDPAALLDERPDYVLLLAWNFAEEIMEQQAEYRSAGGQFIVPVPVPRIV